MNIFVYTREQKNEVARIVRNALILMGLRVDERLSNPLRHVQMLRYSEVKSALVACCVRYNLEWHDLDEAGDK